MTIENDSLYSSLGEAEKYAKDLERQLAEAKNVVTALLVAMAMAEQSGPGVIGSSNYKKAIAKAESFLASPAAA